MSYGKAPRPAPEKQDPQNDDSPADPRPGSLPLGYLDYYGIPRPKSVQAKQSGPPAGLLALYGVGVQRKADTDLAPAPASAPQAEDSTRAAPTSATTGEVKIDETAADPVNQALVEMKKGTPIEQNTQKRISAGTHKIAYLEDIANDPKSDELLKKLGYDPKQYTVKINPWTGGQMIVQNNAVGFATGSNLVGSKKASKARWKTLLCHEVSHLANKDNDTAANSFERYKGEFRAYFLAEFAAVKDPLERARQVRAHILRDYPALKSKYDTDADFKKKVDGHNAPDATDNLDNH